MNKAKAKGIYLNTIKIKPMLHIVAQQEKD